MICRQNPLKSVRGTKLAHKLLSPLLVLACQGPSVMLWTRNRTWGTRISRFSFSILSNLLHIWFPTSPSRCSESSQTRCFWSPWGGAHVPGHLCLVSSRISALTSTQEGQASPESSCTSVRESMRLPPPFVRCGWARELEKGEMDQNKYVRHLAICTRGVPMGLISQSWWAGLLGFESASFFYEKTGGGELLFSLTLLRLSALPKLLFCWSLECLKRPLFMSLTLLIPQENLPQVIIYHLSWSHTRV